MGFITQIKRVPLKGSNKLRKKEHPDTDRLREKFFNEHYKIFFKVKGSGYQHETWVMKPLDKEGKFSPDYDYKVLHTEHLHYYEYFLDKEATNRYNVIKKWDYEHDNADGPFPSLDSCSTRICTVHSVMETLDQFMINYDEDAIYYIQDRFSNEVEVGLDIERGKNTRN